MKIYTMNLYYENVGFGILILQSLCTGKIDGGSQGV